MPKNPIEELLAKVMSGTSGVDLARSIILARVRDWREQPDMHQAMLAHWADTFGDAYGIDPKALSDRDVALFKAGVMVSDLTYQSLPGMAADEALRTIKKLREETRESLDAMQKRRGASKSEPFPMKELAEAVSGMLNALGIMAEVHEIKLDQKTAPADEVSDDDVKDAIADIMASVEQSLIRKS